MYTPQLINAHAPRILMLAGDAMEALGIESELHGMQACHPLVHTKPCLELSSHAALTSSDILR
jgi:hypothetical protein